MSESSVERFEGLPRTELSGRLTVVRASTHRARRRGLSRLDELPEDHALHIPSCFSVHTFGMRFALDLIWLGRDGEIVRVDRDVGPARIRASPRARSVIETRSGQADVFVAAMGGLGQAVR